MKLWKTPFGYVTKTTEHVQLKWVRPEKNIRWEWLSLNTAGLFSIHKGYPTDGPSGPTLDTPATIRGAVFHDGLCQLKRQGFLVDVPEETINAEADEIWDASGMSEWRTEIWEAMLNTFGDFAMDPKNKWEVIEVP